ncbi:hypothetical protein AX15_005274 [Amanita polypyramis BW_CC]|nr:hypothetical protein AX15_005274 [Amanita polypyramis BW_CC]
MARAESVASSKQISRNPTPTPVIESFSPKMRSKSADAVLHSNPTTPDNKTAVDIKTPTLQRIQEWLQSVVLDITSLEYIDEKPDREEAKSPKDVTMDNSTVIVNPAPIRHKTKIQTDLVAEPCTSSENMVTAPVKMDTSEDFVPESSTTQKMIPSSSYTTAPSTAPKAIAGYTEKVSEEARRRNYKGKTRAQSDPLKTLSNPESILNFMDLVEETLSREDQIKFRKELAEKGYSARSAYLEVMLDGLLGEVLDKELHQGHYLPIQDVYNNFNDPIVKFEDQIESVEKDGSLFAILPYELYGDLMLQWLVARKYIQQAISVPSDGSMEKITWAYLNSLFDHRFNDTLSERDFLHAVKGLHGILEKSAQSKYDLTSFGKPIVPSEANQTTTLPEPQQSDTLEEGPSLLQHFYPGSELYTYAYQWADWNGGVDSKGLGENGLVLDTFADGYLTQLGEYEDDHENEKPVGALILAMQAVGCALEHWKTGELSKKEQKFSADNYSDIVVKWDSLIINAQKHLSKDKTTKSRVHSTSATTLIEEEEEEDPDGDFIMDFA